MRKNLDCIPRKAFCLVCPVCGGQIVRTQVGDNPNRLQWRCDQCPEAFGPVWNRVIWGDKPSVKLVGPGVWPVAKPRKILRVARAVLTYVLSYAVALAGMLL